MFIDCYDTHISATPIKTQSHLPQRSPFKLILTQPLTILTFNKDHSESFLDIDVDGLHKILNHLNKLLPGQFIVIVGVIDGVKLIKFLLVE